LFYSKHKVHISNNLLDNTGGLNSKIFHCMLWREATYLANLGISQKVNHCQNQA
jgi:hypothetical protein